MTRNTTARPAGLLYLATLPTARFAYGYIAFMPKNDPAALITALEGGRQALRWTVVRSGGVHRLPAAGGAVPPPPCSARDPEAMNDVPRCQACKMREDRQLSVGVMASSRAPTAVR